MTRALILAAALLIASPAIAQDLTPAQSREVIEINRSVNWSLRGQNQCLVAAWEKQRALKALGIPTTVRLVYADPARYTRTGHALLDVDETMDGKHVSLDSNSPWPETADDERRMGYSDQAQR